MISETTPLQPIDQQSQPLERVAPPDELPPHASIAHNLSGVALGNHVVQLEQSDHAQEEAFEEASRWIDDQAVLRESQVEEVPQAIASQVAILAQRRRNQLDDDFGVVDDESIMLEQVYAEAISVANELDFELVQSSSSWAARAELNAMHDKFRHVSAEEISAFLGDDNGYEYRALFIRNIIADHAPALLTENLKVLVDPTQPVWRAASAHASILLRNRPRSNIDDMLVDKVPTALPVSGRTEYVSEDDGVMKSIEAMKDDELLLYIRPEALLRVRSNGHASFGELTVATREALLTERLFESVSKSNDPIMKQAASERNRKLENDSVLQEGDLVHATRSADVFRSILANGLRCGETIMNNSRATIKYPFTVSFLEVNERVSASKSMQEQLDQLMNGPYGGINMILHRDEYSTESVQGQKGGVVSQRQIFGGVPATEIKSIIIRGEEVTDDVPQKVIEAIIENGVFIPVYDGKTGESLLTSKMFDQLTAGN